MGVAADGCLYLHSISLVFCLVVRERWPLTFRSECTRHCNNCNSLGTPSRSEDPESDNYWLFIQVRQVGSTLLEELTGRCQIRQHLKAMRDLFLGGSPSLLAFSHYLTDRLVDDESIVDISDADLQDCLDLCYASLPRDSLLPGISDLSGGKALKLPSAGSVQAHNSKLTITAAAFLISFRCYCCVCDKLSR